MIFMFFTCQEFWKEYETNISSNSSIFQKNVIDNYLLRLLEFFWKVRKKCHIHYIL